MQTFLPYPSFAQSAAILDYRRLGKQRLEAKQLVSAILFPDYGWQSHPAVAMWRGYVPALALYGLTVCAEWRSRGYRDTLLQWFIPHLTDGKTLMPPWLGDRAFHRSHRSNLLRKEPLHYKGRHGFRLPDNLPYIWPTS